MLLLSTSADCCGLTLTCAQHLFAMDATVSPLLMAQLAARMCRQGQVRPCTLHNMVGASVDEACLKVRLQQLSAEVGSGGGSGAGSSSSSSSGGPLLITEVDGRAFSFSELMQLLRRAVGEEEEREMV